MSSSGTPEQVKQVVFGASAKRKNRDDEQKRFLIANHTEVNNHHKYDLCNSTWSMPIAGLVDTAHDTSLISLADLCGLLDSEGSSPTTKEWDKAQMMCIIGKIMKGNKQIPHFLMHLRGSGYSDIKLLKCGYVLDNVQNTLYDRVRKCTKFCLPLPIGTGWFLQISLELTGRDIVHITGRDQEKAWTSYMYEPAECGIKQENKKQKTKGHIVPVSAETMLKFQINAMHNNEEIKCRPHKNYGGKCNNSTRMPMTAQQRQYSELYPTAPALSNFHLTSVANVFEKPIYLENIIGGISRVTKEYIHQFSSTEQQDINNWTGALMSKLLEDVSWNLAHESALPDTKFKSITMDIDMVSVFKIQYY